MVTPDQHPLDPSEEENDDLPFSAIAGHFQHVFELERGFAGVRGLRSRSRPAAPVVLADAHDDRLRRSSAAAADRSLMACVGGERSGRKFIQRFYFYDGPEMDKTCFSFYDLPKYM